MLFISTKVRIIIEHEAFFGRVVESLWQYRSILPQFWSQSAFLTVGANSRSLAGALNFAQNLDLGAVINGLFEQAQELVSSLNVPQLLQNAVDQVLSQLGV